MRTELPTQGQIVEELADRVAIQIDAGKPVAFDGALEELVRYHRFVLGLSASTTPDGDPFNYAELAGNSWHPPHLEWLHQYRRLFERAADRIPDDEHFIVNLAYTMGRLLRLPDDLVPSNGVTDAVLNLFPSLVGSVEAWVTKRAIVQKDSRGGSRQVLAGSDARAYSTALLGVLGAWEGLFHYSGAVTDISRHRSPDAARTWALARRAWAFLYRHLVNTTYSVAIAVWNQDEMGAAALVEALMRWPENIRHQLPHALHVRHPELVMPDLMKQDWDGAVAAVAGFTYHLRPVPDPGELFALIVFQVHGDLRLLLARVLLHWTVSGKREGLVGARVATDMLSGAAAGDDGRHGDKTSFGSLLFALIRQQIAGERFEDGSHGANLDAVVRSLDGMTEKDRVSGRVYQPTTASERDDLIWSDVTLLAIYADQDDGGALDKRVQDFVEAEDALPRGDRTLRTVLYEFHRYLDVLDTRPPQILEALEQSGREDARGDIDKLGVILRRTESIIAAHRAKRLHDRQIDAAKLEERRAAVEQGLMDEGNLDFFAAAKIVTVEDKSEGDVHRFSFNTSKARLLDPPMDQEVHGEIEAMVASVVNWANTRPSAWLLHSVATDVEVMESPLEPAFWEALHPMIAEVGRSPRLILPYRFHAALIDLIFPSNTRAMPNLTVEERQHKPHGYVCTIEGVDIHVWGVEEDLAWLLSGEKLRTIQYGLVDGQRVTVEFVPSDGDAEHAQDRLHFRFRPTFEWNEGPVFRIRLADSTDGEVGNDTEDDSTG